MNGTVVATIRLQGPSLDPLIAWLEQLGPTGTVMPQVLREAVVLGLLRKIRERFLRTADKALKVRYRASADPDGVSTTRGAKAMTTLQRLRLYAAYRRLDEAMISKGPQEQARARAALQRAQNRYLTQLQTTGELASMRSKKQELIDDANDVPRIGAIVSGLMQQRQLQVLRLLTSPSQVQMTMNEYGNATAVIGNMMALEAVETPSASPIISAKGRLTSLSPHKTLWRHMEFGTGVYKRLSNKLNPVKKTPFQNPDGSWYYGKGRRAGLQVLGSEPMRFLYANDQGGLFDEDVKALLEAFAAAMERSAPKLGR